MYVPSQTLAGEWSRCWWWCWWYGGMVVAEQQANQIIRECKYLTSVSHRTQCSKADCRFRVSPVLYTHAHGVLLDIESSDDI